MTHIDNIWPHGIDTRSALKIAVTFRAPYLISTGSSVTTIRDISAIQAEGLERR